MEKREFVFKRVEKALCKKELVLACNLLKMLSPLPEPFDLVFSHIYTEKLKEPTYQHRLEMAVRLCMKSIKRGGIHLAVIGTIYD
ncbi:MAG TPA: hypothetical protein PK747_06065 [Acidobacteriota bacterium]|nr:hypothetical protein [Acidobacteriota bacterium]HNT18178.1 hypothetical protein [Acidobacteriota bacterium]HQO19913.1 hypothetical protein [Acidobacteriota bacterium]HQQ46960.1 hypothetical protein [Acidobacteriota bacterium]